MFINFPFCFFHVADGYPHPTYEWFKEAFENDELVAKKIDPLADPRFTVSGGTLIINNPRQVRFMIKMFM